ncbi:hypothetical protein GA0074695_4797 [Micromonospora viridifaciens]|uniref:Uncharacterized protein n=1 Tax=Micromonospora viridifaciens TaxID=1881 RepID=A0A1C4YWR7_MICVI|nr:hypothetical protein [Micromonospora viridifaciens]SCF25077.1 hypothetical protein GA0074695_4797 [Micromonospora viridifaciens]
MVFVSLTVGAIAAATASFVGWRLVSPSPTVEEATAAVRIGLPDASIASIGWHDDVRDIHFVEQPSADNVPGQQQVQLRDGATSRDAFDKARERLAGAGWRTKVDSNMVQGGGFFLASRGDLVMEWEFSPSGRYTEPSGDSIEVWVWRFTPIPVKILTLAGWLLGAASGWWLARTVLRLAHRRAVIGLAAVAGVLALSTLATVIFTAQNLLNLPMRNGQPTAIWTAYFPFLMPFGFQFG